MIKTFIMLKEILTFKDKKLIGFVIFLAIIVSIIEMVGISAIMPFLSAVTNTEMIYSNQYFRYFYNILNFDNKYNFIIFFGSLLILFYFLRSVINIYYTYVSTRFTQFIFHSIANRLFNQYLKISYLDFTKKNSSTLTKTIVTETTNLIMVINALLSIFAEFLIVILLYGFMLYTNYQITLLLTLFLLLNGFFMLKLVTSRIKTSGNKREELQRVFYEIMNRTFGNFKLLKLQKDNKNTSKEFENASFGYVEANTFYGTLSQVPRLYLEFVGFSLVIGMVIFIVWQYKEQSTNILPVISVFVLALYRLMPSFNRIMTAVNTIVFYHKALLIVYDDLCINAERNSVRIISFKNKIDIENITFEYDKDKSVINNISLTIKKGDKIAFIGESGSGKSTLVDIIIGLYLPNEGKILVDTEEIKDINIQSLRQKVGYIPQKTYLFDGTVGQNVAFSHEKYDRDKVDNCLKKANIYNFLQQKKGQDTIVGEGGIMLSGGQQQRISIARALYLEPEILVLDEATSALDTQVEEKIMEEIYSISKDKTLIIIAHRLSTIENCDVIYTLENGSIKSIKEKDKSNEK
jgi:ATP-binding cassette, subfamily B, bacterial PglK